jgi:hypothetical protein
VTSSIASSSVAFAVAAGVLFDRLDLAFVANRFPDQGFDPVKAVENNGIKVVLLGLERPDLGQEIADRFGLREPCDIELFGTFLGTDKDWVRSVGTQS